MQKYFSFDTLLTLRCCLSQLGLQLNIYKTLELLGDAFVCPVTGLLPLTSRHALTTLGFPLLLLSQGVSHPGGFLQHSRLNVRGHLKGTSRLLTPGERTPNYMSDLRPAADQLLGYPLLNCTFFFQKYGLVWLHGDFLSGRS